MADNTKPLETAAETAAETALRKANVFEQVRKRVQLETVKLDVAIDVAVTQSIVDGVTYDVFRAKGEGLDWWVVRPADSDGEFELYGRGEHEDANAAARFCHEMVGDDDDV